LSLSDGKQQSQSNSCDDLVSETEVVVLSQQNLSNHAFAPGTWKGNVNISWNRAKWKIYKNHKNILEKNDKNMTQNLKAKQWQERT
jgi:hypothetical protein